MHIKLFCSSVKSLELDTRVPEMYVGCAILELKIESSIWKTVAT